MKPVLPADLDSTQFSVRDNATSELEKLVELAEPTLRNTLAGEPSVEVRRRIEPLLSRSEEWSPEHLSQPKSGLPWRKTTTSPSRTVPAGKGGEEEGEAKQAGGCVPMATNWTADFYSKMLFDLIHPEGLPCPRCHEPNGLHMFRRHLNSWIVDYRCSHCWRIFNPWEGDALERSHHPHRELLGMILGMTEGKPTTHLADRNRPHPQS
jgi:hypothetical protein